MVSHRKDKMSLEEKIQHAHSRVQVGATYRHYKSKDMTYRVVGIAVYEPTLEPVVLYKPLYGNLDVIWVRAVSVWCEDVEVSEKKVKRFSVI
jgi:hypothetical protein